MWTPEHRRAADRIGLRYPSDLSDAEWALIEPLIPPAKRGGAQAASSRCARGAEWRFSTCWRPAANGKRCRRTCRRRARRTITSCCGTGTARWSASITRFTWRARTGRTRSQPNGRDHRQPERQRRAKRGASLDPQGFDAGKKVTGRKRHILVDTLGLMLSVAVHPANIQDRDGVALVLDRRTRRLFPFIERIFADGGYQGPKAAQPRLERAHGRSRSSNAPRKPTASRSCPNAGSSSELSPGSVVSAVWPATSSAMPEPSWPSSASP